MRSLPKSVVVVSALAVLAVVLILGSDQTGDGARPDISLIGGQIPDVDVNVGDARVVEDTKTVPETEIAPPSGDS